MNDDDHGTAVRRRQHPLLLLGAVALAVALIWLLVQTLVAKPESKRKQVVQSFQLIKPPPPPPPPKEPPKPPEIKKEQVKLEQPKVEQPKAATPEQPPAQQLGLDAKGTGAGDSFGLAANQGGRDVTQSGQGGGGGAVVIGPDPRTQFRWYAQALQRQFDEECASIPNEITTRSAQATVRVWIGADSVMRMERVGATGDAELDNAIDQCRNRLQRARVAAPTDMPQPITMRVRVRGG